MDTTHPIKNARTAPVDEQEVSISHNFVLRVWKTGENSFKGYIIDPLTNMRYPLRNISQEICTSTGECKASMGILIESVGCWVGLWSEQPAEGDV